MKGYTCSKHQYDTENSHNHSKQTVLYPLSVLFSEHQHTQVKMVPGIALTHCLWKYFEEISIYCNTIIYIFHTESEN